MLRYLCSPEQDKSLVLSFQAMYFSFPLILEMAWISNADINTASPLNCRHHDGPPSALIHSRQHLCRQQPHHQNK